MPNSNEEDFNPFTAKIVLIIFGLGPIIGMIIFLAFNGFFTPPSF